MESKFESKIGKINSSAQNIYGFVSDFNNFRKFIPADKVKDFQSTENDCKFNISGVGDVGLKITEKEPYHTVKISGDGMANQKFDFWIQLKEVTSEDTRIKLTIKADLNPVLKMMASKPLQNFLDKLVEAMEKMNFN